MEITVLKKRYLLNSQATYLLSRISHYLVTKTNYEELLILDCDLQQIKIVLFAQKNLAVYQVFYNQQNNRLLFELDDEDFMLVLDAEQLQLHTVYAEELRDITTPLPYVWVDRYFFVVDRYDRGVIRIDTISYELQIMPVSEGYNLAPELKRLEELYRSISPYHYIYEEQIFIVMDYEKSKTLSIVSFNGKVIRRISIAKELPTKLRRRPNGSIFDPELIPHEIRYQNGWLSLVFEVKVVVISPQNKRITRYPGDRFEDARARFIKTAPCRADCVVLVSAKSYEDSSRLERWHVAEHSNGALRDESEWGGLMHSGRSAP